MASQALEEIPDHQLVAESQTNLIVYSDQRQRQTSSTKAGRRFDNLNACPERLRGKILLPVGVVDA